MKTKIFLVFLSFVFVANFVFAQGLSNQEKIKNTSERRQDKIEEIQQIKKDKFEGIKNKNSENKQKLSTQKKERVEGLTNSAFQRLKNISKFFENFIFRIENRIAFWEEKGLDFSKTKLELKNLESKLESLDVSVDEAQKSIQEILLKEDVSGEAIREIILVLKKENILLKGELIKLTEILREELKSQLSKEDE